LKGDEYTFQETVHFKVLDVERRAVVRARVEFPTPDQDDDGGDTAVIPDNDHKNKQ
jgi:hypothetical protein